MADRQGLITFDNRPTIGAEVILPRGITPGRILVRTLPDENYNGAVGDVAITFDGNLVATLTKCALADTNNQLLKDSDGYHWDHVLYDRRWKWRYATVNGEYNARKVDGSIDYSTQVNARLLANACLDAMGETGYDTSPIPEDVYPYVNWRRARADLQLAYLCDLVGAVPGLDLDDKAKVWRINVGSDLPGDEDAITPLFRSKPTLRPSKLRVACGPTTFQRWFSLIAVGLDVDGSLKLIGDLSYMPAGGWGTQWWNAFADVAAASRPVAFKTVFRWYRLNGFTPGSYAAAEIPTTIESSDQIVLNPWCAETRTDFASLKKPIPAWVKGTYWPTCDLKLNVTRDYGGPFRIIPELGVVEFEYPIFAWGSDGHPTEATLQLLTSFYVKEQESEGLIHYTHDLELSGALETTEARTLKHSELRRVIVTDGFSGTASDNVASVLIEAESYLNANAETYDDLTAGDRIYEGLRYIQPSGAVTCITWRCGYGRPAITRGSQRQEHELYGPTHQQLRRLQRLAQLVDNEEI